MPPIWTSLKIGQVVKGKVHFYTGVKLFTILYHQSVFPSAKAK